jgi:integrase/recombinase XerD
MNESQSLGIDFIIRKCKADKQRGDIYARITVDGGQREISIKEQIRAADWISESEIVKGKSIEARAINERINNIRFRIKDKFRLLEDKGELITAESLKHAYLGVQNKLKGRKLKELLNYYKEIWILKSKPGGFKNYKTTIKYIERFLEYKYNGTDIFLSQVNMEFATNFEHYIRTNPVKAHDPCKGNGVGKHIQRFKRILNWAKELKWIDSNHCEKYSCPLKKSKRKKLTIEALVAIEQETFQNETLNYVKELFLNSCYTGFAFADAMALEESNFEWEMDGVVWCKIYRTKSDELCSICSLIILGQMG